VSSLRIVYGFCEDRHKARLFDNLVQNTPVLKIKTIGHVVSKAVFAALTHSAQPVQLDGVDWLHTLIANKRKSVASDTGTCPALPRKKMQRLALSDEQIKQLQKARRVYRKRRNLVLTAQNWRQHLNRKAAVEAVQAQLLPVCPPTFLLAPGQHPTPYSLGC